MKKEVQWLAHLGIERGFLDRERCRALAGELGEDVELLGFGEAILDKGLWDDFEGLQQLVEQAWDNAQAGHAPVSDPFAEEVADPFGPETDRAPVTPGDGPPVRRTIALKPKAKEEPEPERAAPPEAPARKAISFKPKSQQGAEPAPEPPAAAAPPPQAPPPAAAPPPAPAPVPDAPVEEDAGGLLSDAMPDYSLDVEEGMPDFESLAGLDERGYRQALIQMLLESQRLNASDLHLSTNARPFARVNRSVEYLSEHIMTAEEALALNTALLTERQRFDFDRVKDLDFALALDASNRYRVNLMMHHNGAAGTYRIVTNRIKSLEELGFENAETIKKLLAYHNGLILVTGPVGAGKTATLAALVDELNRTREDHIIEVEAPIEIVQTSGECQITQREVGPHTRSFHSALKGALRQDPDIIVIGEMRDLETIEMAISASETGHLVIGTMHTSDASTTLNRLLDVFPSAQQGQIRAMVSESLRGIICQRLLPTGNGVVLACELLLNNTAVKNLIRENKAEGLVNVMETGAREGMLLMDKSIMELWKKKVISDDVALDNLVNKMMRNQVRPPVKPAPAEEEEAGKGKRGRFRK